MYRYFLFLWKTLSIKINILNFKIALVKMLNLLSLHCRLENRFSRTRIEVRFASNIEPNLSTLGAEISSSHILSIFTSQSQGVKG